MKPQTRRDGLLVKELQDETLVYDTKSHRAHCLNRTAALVFKLSNGTASVDEIARQLPSDLGSENNEKLVWLALRQLEKADLLEESPPSPPPELGSCSRREMVRRLGLGLAALLPLVTSIVAPTPAEAAASCVVSCNGMLDYTRCGDCIDDYCLSGTCQNV